MGVRRQNAAMVTLKHVFAWRRTTKWRNTKAMSIKVDPGNHTRWKHKWEWHKSRLYVGQNCLGMVRRRGAEHNKKKMPV